MAELDGNCAGASRLAWERTPQPDVVQTAALEVCNAQGSSRGRSGIGYSTAYIRGCPGPRGYPQE